jgi:hypothetical protein
VLAYDGQRNHKARSTRQASIRHITKPSSTQRILQCARLVKGKHKGQLKLIDGYHRVYHWLNVGSCPFTQLVVIVHEVQDENELWELFKTIDSKQAVKKNKDFYASALRGGGLDAPSSKAYTHGTNAGSFFSRPDVIGDANHPLVYMAERVRSRLLEHQLMDELFTAVEASRRASVRENLHAGVALAIFRTLSKLKSSSQKERFAQLVLRAIQLNSGAEVAQTPRLKVMANLLGPKLAQATPGLKAKGSNTEDWYNNCAEWLEAELQLVASAKPAARSTIKAKAA